MSVLDELKAMERQILDRLRELEPVIAEYQELRRAAERLGLDYEQSVASLDAAPAGGRSRSRGNRAAVTRAGRDATTRRRSGPEGRRAEQLLDAVRKQPGITVPEVGEQLGIDYTGLYRVVRRLEQEGRLTKQGRQLRLRAS